jgi:membrane associated rhomboid family serine protease
MQPAFTAITVRSERQAMDWSLVLVSQGIDATIERDPEANTWQLVVNAPDYSRAIHALRQYRAENQRRAWRQELPWTALIFDWRSAVVMLSLVFLYAVEATGRGDLSAAGMMDNRAVHSGQWWRLFTAVMLHGDLPHLVANVTTGLLLLGLAMGAFGPGLGLLASFLAGVGGNVAGLLIYPEAHRGLGASGMVMGALGLLAAQSFALLRHGLTPRQLAVRGVLSGCLLLVLLGFSPARNVDVLAHVAGFITGLGLGAALALCPPALPQSAWANRLALATCLGLAAVTWWLALRPAGVHP